MNAAKTGAAKPSASSSSDRCVFSRACPRRPARLAVCALRPRTRVTRPEIPPIEAIQAGGLERARPARRSRSRKTTMRTTIDDQHPGAGARQPLAVGVVRVVARQAHEEGGGERGRGTAAGAPRSRRRARRRAARSDDRGKSRVATSQAAPPPRAPVETITEELARRTQLPHPDPREQEAAQVEQHAEQDEADERMEPPSPGRRSAEPDRGTRLRSHAQ